MITAARWSNPEQTLINVTVDGNTIVASPIAGLEIYDQIKSDGIIITPYQPTADDVRAEAQRRIMALMQVSDFNGCIVKQLNANMRATELTNKLALNLELTPEETAEAQKLHALGEAVKAIRAASNVMEPNPPTDYADNSRWPSI